MYRAILNLPFAIWLCLLMFSFSNAQGQLNYSETHYSLDGIVPENQCKEMVRDRKGYYWIITLEGTLLRWNGSSFVLGSGYNRFEKNRILPFFWNCNLSPDGTPYFKPLDKHLPVFYIDSNSHVQKLNCTDSSISTYLYNGNFIRLRKTWKEIAKRNDHRLYERFRQAFLYDDRFLLHVSVSDDHFYLVSNDEILFYNNGAVRLIAFPGNPAAKAAWLIDDYLVVKNGITYAVYRNGVMVANGFDKLLENLSMTTTKFSNSVHAVYAADGHFVYRFTISSNALQSEKHLELAPYRSSFNFITADEPGGRILLGETSGGFSVFELALLKHLNTTSDPQKNIIVTMCPDGEGFLTNQDFQNNIKDGLDVQRFFNPFVQTPDGEYFYPSARGFFLFDKEKKIKQRWDINTADFVTSIAAAGDNIYISGGNLWYYDMKRKVADRYKGTPALAPTDKVRAVLAGPTGSLYIVINSYIFQLQLATGNLKKISGDTIPSGYVRSLQYDKTYHALFIAIKNKGLFYCDITAGKVRPLPADHFPELYSCHYMLRDKDGDYWLPTNNALFLLYKEQLEHFVKNKGRYLNYYRFGRGHGLGNDEYNGGLSNAGLYLRDSLFLSSMNGIVSFAPEQLKRMSKMVSRSGIEVYEVQVDDTVLSANSNISLPPDYKSCIVRLDFPYISMPGALLEYQLEGIKDTSWLPVGNQSDIVLRNLSPGNYSLRVRVHDQPYVDMLVLQIHARQYWYKTRLASAAGVVLLAGLLFLFFNWRIQRIRNRSLKEIDQQRRQMFMIISHDLRTPLNAYQGIAETISYLLRKNDFGRVQELALSLETKGVKLKLLLNNLLNWNLLQNGKLNVRNEFVSVSSLLQEHVKIYNDIASERDIQIMLSENGKADIEADTDLLSLLLRNLLDNAIKNSGRGKKIQVVTGFVAEKLIVEVSNYYSRDQRSNLEIIKKRLQGNSNWEPGVNGMGMGLKMVQMAAKKMNATLNMDIQEEVVIFGVTFSGEV